MRRKAAGREGIDDAGSEMRIEQLLARHVYRDPNVRWPAYRFLAGLLQDPLTDRHDQPGVLSQRDELGGADRAMLAAIPAEQCLETDHSLARRVDHGLEVQREFVAIQRPA